LIILIILGKEYKTPSSSLCSFEDLHNKCTRAQHSTTAYSQPSGFLLGLFSDRDDTVHVAPKRQNVYDLHGATTGKTVLSIFPAGF
jgi:hypothetical protein